MKPSLTFIYFRNYPSVLVCILLSILCTRASAEEYKIGVVDAQKVLEQSPQAERMASELRKEFESRNREIIDMQKRLTEINEQLTNNIELSDGDKEKLARDQYLLSRDLQRVEKEYKEDLSYRRNEILVALQDEIIEAIEAVSLKYQFDIVLNDGSNWASARVNMTPLVIDYLRKKEN